MSIQVSIVGNELWVRQSVCEFINGSEGFSFQTAFVSGEEALASVPEKAPDVLLLDIHLPGMSGIECLRKLKARVPKLPIVMFTACDQSEQFFEALMAGASGYLLKETPPEQLLTAIAEAHKGGSPMSPQVARKVVQYFHQLQRFPAKNPQPYSREMDTLTKREQEVLAHLAQGFRYKEMAVILGISLETVRGHLRKVYEKLQVTSRTEAVVKFLGH